MLHSYCSLRASLIAHDVFSDGLDSCSGVSIALVQCHQAVVRLALRLASLVLSQPLVIFKPTSLHLALSGGMLLCGAVVSSLSVQARVLALLKLINGLRTSCRLFFGLIYPSYGSITAIESVSSGDDTQVPDLCP